jgi:hypothetical protein
MHFKLILIIALFVSQALAAAELVVQIDECRRDAYNRMASDNAVPGYTVKLKRIFRNKPAERQASLQEKEAILKAVIATALIHDDKMTLFDSADDVIPDFGHHDVAVRSHFEILWHAEYFARNSIRAILKEYDKVLAEKYGAATDDALSSRVQDEARRAINAQQIINSDESSHDLRQLERLSGIRADDFARWVSEVYNEHCTGLYMDESYWRMSSAYTPSDLEGYELSADEHYRQFKGPDISSRLILSAKLSAPSREGTVEDSRRPLEAELVRSDADFNEILCREMIALNDFEINSEQKIKAANSLKSLINEAPENIAFEAAKFILVDRFRLDSSHVCEIQDYAVRYMGTVVASGSNANALEAAFLLLNYVYKSNKSLEERSRSDIASLLISVCKTPAHPQIEKAASYLLWATKYLPSLFCDPTYEELCVNVFRTIASNPNHEKAFEVVDSMFKEKEPDFALNCYLAIAENIKNSKALEAADSAIRILKKKGLLYDRSAYISLGEQYVRALKALCLIVNKNCQRDAENFMTSHLEEDFQDDRMTILRAKTIVEHYKDSERVVEAAVYLLAGNKVDPLTSFPVKYAAIRRLEAMASNPESPMNERAKSVLARSARL